MSVLNPKMFLESVLNGNFNVCTSDLNLNIRSVDLLQSSCSILKNPSWLLNSIVRCDISCSNRDSRLNRLCSDEQNEIQTMPPKAPAKAGVAGPPVGGNNGNDPNNGGNGNDPNAGNPVQPPPPMVEDSDWGTWEAIKSSHSGEADDPELIPISASTGISPDTPMLFSGGLGSVIFRLWLIPLVRETFLFFHRTLVFSCLG